MRVCLIGDFSPILEEGMRNISYHYKNQLSRNNTIISLNARNIASFNSFKSIKKFNPDIIHYLMGPTILSMIIMKIFKIICRDSIVIISATHPSSFKFSKSFLRFLKPDLMITQSKKTDEFFSELKINTAFLPNGVDIQKFFPTSHEKKNILRRKFGIAETKFIILHVGSIKQDRGLKIFSEIQKMYNDIQVIIVGPKSLGIEGDIYKILTQNGCKIITDYVENIEEIYLLSDVYIFPTDPNNSMNSIELPLSIFEAMSCNLPVITTKFGGINSFFHEGNGLFIVDNQSEIFKLINDLKETQSPINNRIKVLDFSWERISEKLQNIYTKLKQTKEMK